MKIDRMLACTTISQLLNSTLISISQDCTGENILYLFIHILSLLKLKKMKPFLLFFGLSLLCCFNLRAQANEIAAIKKLNYNWLNAYPKKDTATLSKILANDFILIKPAGLKQNKKDYLLNMADPNIETISVNIDSVDVTMASPNVAVLNAWANFTFIANGKQLTGKSCYQDV
jgi:ketosteroid isomerase-like protein